MTFSIAQVVVEADPVLAYRLVPYDGRITAAYASSLAAREEVAPQGRALADDLAKRALWQDPVAVAAAVTLGMNADARGDTAAARRYFAYAQTLSRRDLWTQLFMIEDAVQRGDVPAALHQYDITLRVFPKMGDLLFPVLASASGNPEIRNSLVKTLARKPLWSDGFISFAAWNSPDPKVMAALFVDLGRSDVAIPEAAAAGAVNTLIAAGQLSAAWSLYAVTRPGADHRRSRDPKFAITNQHPSQLDWTPINDGGVTTGIRGGVFDFAAPASIGGALLQQLQLLPAGSYRLIGHSTGIEQAPEASPYWTLRCKDGRELGRIEIPNSKVTKGRFLGNFNVPTGCPIQMLVLMARSSDTVTGLSGQIDRVELVPVD
ncbi:hypothetical protein NF699_00185 (plasmid) [Sphingomonadaceae bacterium OTU29LAMAA1]|nr:hypothetical protein NF699_00185 [Sphingomonadaceae bacterium OTU29LAMAA1]